MDASDFNRWRLLPAAGAFLCGTLVLFALPAPPGLTASLVVGGGALLALRFSRSRTATALVVASCGFLYAEAHALRHLQHGWAQAQEGERARTLAIVESIPEARGAEWSFDATIRVEAPHPRATELKARLISRDPLVRPQAGERWQLLISLRPPRAALNPGSIDVERLLFHDRIQALGTVVPSRLNYRIDSGRRPLTALRERIARHIEERVDDRDGAALMSALAVGATGAISREQWRVFNVTGTTHLVAISGLHVTLVALVAFALARRVWSLLVWRWLSCSRDSFAAAVGLACATAYAVLAGLSVPTQRTLIMLAAWLASRALARTSAPLQPLAIALLVVLFLDPFAPLTAGFWLSFGAMGAILLVTESPVQRRRPVHEAVAVQAAVTVMLVPLTLACFGSISLVGPFVNGLAIPYMSWVLVPVVLASVVLLPLWPQGSDLALDLAQWLHDLAWPWLAAAADSSLAVAYASPPWWWYPIAVGAAFIALTPWPVCLRLTPIICALPLLAANPYALRSGDAELTVLDCGEGTAIVVRTARHVLLYGTGESYGTAGRRVDNIVVPFLRSRGFNAIDRLAVAKLTPISGSGITALLASMPVRSTLLGRPAVLDFAGATRCETQEPWVWDGVRFEVRDDCEIRVVNANAQMDLVMGSVRLAGAGPGWTLIAGQGGRGGSTRLAGSEGRSMATADVGAIRVTMNESVGLGRPRGLRASRALWRQGSTTAPPAWK